MIRVFGTHTLSITTGSADPASDRAIRSAQTLEATDPAAASRAWTHIDHQLTDQAASIPFVNPRAFDFVSARVRNYQDAGGILADQLWLR